MKAEVECKEVIITTILRRGKGIEGSPVRCITQVYTKDGVLIAEQDPFPETFTPEDMRQFARWCCGNDLLGESITTEKVFEWVKPAPRG